MNTVGHRGAERQTARLGKRILRHLSGFRWDFQDIALFRSCGCDGVQIFLESCGFEEFMVDVQAKR